jgi:hypothetical protein
LWLLCLSPSVSSAQDTTGPTPFSIAVASVVPAAVMYGALYQNYNDFWKAANRAPFHFSSDPPYTMHSDKFGHAYYTYACTDLIKIAYREVGVDPKTAVWIGAGVTLLAQTMVEIGDGFRTGAPYFGFSPGDQISNLLGAGLAIGKEYEPELRRIDFKLGFKTSEAYKQGAFSSILDDNESRYFWLTFNFLDFIHEDMPRWLNLGFGYGVENIVTEQYVPGRARGVPTSLMYVGPDINLRQLPIKGQVWEVIAEILDHIRIPLPGLQVSPIVKWHWLAF